MNREVRRAYDDLGGELYDLRYREEQERKFEAFLSKISISQDDLILDLGCGTGLLLEKISGTVGFAVGLDISERLLSWARSKLRGTQTALILSDADYLPFRLAAFDKVFAITLLQNLPEPRRALSESRAVAKSAATIILSGLKKKYSREEFLALLSSVGLRVEEVVDEELKDFLAICRKS
jgi:ubiquinone/menaquinone biosynthesis C-methylase UbiE